MKRTVSEVEKVSEQNTEASTSESSQPPPKKRRGPTRCKNVIHATTLLPLRINKFGQPIGPGSGTYTNYLGTLAQKGKLAPLYYKTWWEMPKRLKEDLWNIESKKKNKEHRGKQTMMHTTGTKSFARVFTEENIRELQKSYFDSPIGSSNDLFSIVCGCLASGLHRAMFGSLS